MTVEEFEKKLNKEAKEEIKEYYISTKDAFDRYREIASYNSRESSFPTPNEFFLEEKRKWERTIKMEYKEVLEEYKNNKEKIKRIYSVDPTFVLAYTEYEINEINDELLDYYGNLPSKHEIKKYDWYIEYKKNC